MKPPPTDETVGAWRVSCAGHHANILGTLEKAMVQADLAAWTWGHVAIVTVPNWDLRGWRLVYTARPPKGRARVDLPEGVRE